MKPAAPPTVAPQADYKVIARRYRPQTFEEVVGQETVVRNLQGDLAEGRIGHAYLLSGPRGVGKTSMARIFAKALNCEKGPTPTPCGVCRQCREARDEASLDVIEVDAATYNKREETEQLLEGIDRATFSARYRVYIIDEVHMFSQHSFNVLLKRLEEPPPRVVFILATTNPEKLPETVISRCRHCQFDRIETAPIAKKLGEIADREGATFAEGQRDAVLEAVALASDGGMRDAQVMLDQLISISRGAITLDTARQLLGVVDAEVLERLLGAIAKRDTTAALLLVDELSNAGRDLERFVTMFLTYLRDALLLKAGAPAGLLKVARAAAEELGKIVATMPLPLVLNAVNQFVELEERVRGAAPPRFLLEFALIRLTAIHPTLLLESYTTEPPGNRTNPTPPSPQRPAPPPPTTPARYSTSAASRASAPMVAERPGGSALALSPVRVGDEEFEADVVEALDPIEEGQRLHAERQRAKPAAMGFAQALELYPELRAAVDLVKEHLGADPVTFDGKPLKLAQSA